jgi:hypothetical protein
VTRQLNARGLLTLENIVEFFNLILNMRLMTYTVSK